MESTIPHEEEVITNTSEPTTASSTDLPIRNINNSNDTPATLEDLPPAYEPQPTADETIEEEAPFRAEDFAKDGKKHILLAASGSVATIKLPNIITALSSANTSHAPGLSIRVILTDSATHFLSGVSPENPTVESLRHLPNVEGIYTDVDEWKIPWERGHAILHIELRKWADIMAVAPLDANTLAKITNGISDNLLTSVLRAWDPEGTYNPAGRQNRAKTLIVAPAMNTAMWLHPITKKQIRVLEEEWAEVRKFRSSTGPPRPGTGSHSYKKVPWAWVLKPVEKQLACGDQGVGAMVDWRVIVKEIMHHGARLG